MSAASHNPSLHEAPRSSRSPRDRDAPKATAVPPADAPKPRAKAGRRHEELARAVGRLRRGFAIVALFSVVVNILALTSAIYLMQVSDRVLLSRNIDTLIMLTVVTVGAIAVYGLLDVLRKKLLTRLALGFEAQLSGHVLTSSLSVSDGGKAQDVQGLRDMQSVRGFVSGPVMPLLFDAPIAPFYVFIVWLIHPELGWITIIGSLVLAIFAGLNQALTTKTMMAASRAAMEATNRAHAQVRNSEVVVAMGMVDDCVASWGQANAESLKHHASANDRNSMIAGLSKVARLFLQIALLGWGAWLVLQGEISGGAMITASIIAGRGLQPVEGAIEGWRSTVQAREAYGRLKAVLERPEMLERFALATPQGALSVEGVAYVPPGRQKPILANMTFALQPGESLAIIGPSGAGKSTLVRLIAGTLQPNVGAVRIDGADLRTWDRRLLGPHIGYLPQSVELFPGTVALNIARMRVDAPSDAVLMAAKFAAVDDVINRLPDGFNMMLGPDGAPLSGGQKQRIGLARAFYGQPRYVLLDEPNSNLDGMGEQALITALNNARQAKITVVVVTQRPSLLRAVDKILAMRDGSIELFGPAEQVIAEIRKSHSGGAPS